MDENPRNNGTTARGTLEAVGGIVTYTREAHC
jgi:hypothetical protein